MTDRSHRGVQYVLVNDSKPRKSNYYYYDADADDDSQSASTTRQIIQTKPSKEERIRYITTDDIESDYRRPKVAHSHDRGIKVRKTTTGDEVVLDEDNNIIKIIRHRRSTTPPYAEKHRSRTRPHESQSMYYETSDGHLMSRPKLNHRAPKAKTQYIYTEDEPTKVVRKIIVDPDHEPIYEKPKPKKAVHERYVIRRRPSELPVETDNDDDQQPEYVQVVPRRAGAKQEVPTASTKYMMIRKKKVDSEPVYAVESTLPTVRNNRRIVYESPTKKPSTTYVYATDGKYYK